jgi:hypothetical protein
VRQAAKVKQAPDRKAEQMMISVLPNTIVSEVHNQTSSHETLVTAYFARAKASLLDGISQLGPPLIFLSTIIAFPATSQETPAIAQLVFPAGIVMLLLGLALCIGPIFFMRRIFSSQTKELKSLPLWIQIIGLTIGLFGVAFALYMIFLGVSDSDWQIETWMPLCALGFFVAAIGKLFFAYFHLDQAIKFQGTRRSGASG